jgi:DNA (cytosine-5)-methyltransferase 1
LGRHPNPELLRLFGYTGDKKISERWNTVEGYSYLLYNSITKYILQPETTISMSKLNCLEICAGAGGQALGLERAGFGHAALVDNDDSACATLRWNRPRWNVLLEDLADFRASGFSGVDLLAGGVPCPPFSVAGLQRGKLDERDLFPQAIRLVRECKPKAVMLENVRGLLDPRFKKYRAQIQGALRELRYETGWRLLNASQFGVPQLRPRLILVALRKPYAKNFSWPVPPRRPLKTVGAVLEKLMASRGWERANEWALAANAIAPTVVGGSKKHGGPDLGPVRARRAWLRLGVDGKGIADQPPGPEHVGLPRLTVRMVALLQGFPPDWVFVGKKTAAYRQVGNAFPPPVAQAVGQRILDCLQGSCRSEIHIPLEASSQEQLDLAFT